MSLLKNLCFLMVCVLAVYAKTNIQSRAIGSQNAGFVPYVAWLRQSTLLGLGENKPFCIAALISPTFALTSAHCLCLEIVSKILAGLPLTAAFLDLLICNLQPSSAFKVYVNTKYANTGGSEYAVKRSIKHPDFQPRTLENDIGLIELRSAIFETTVAYVSIGECEVPEDYTEVQAFDFENADSLFGTRPTELQVRTVNIYPLSKCQSDMANAGLPILSEIVCTINEGNCNGGDGGGLLVKGDARTIVGVVSWGVAPPGTCNAPSVYTNVCSYRDWIEQTIEEQSR